MILSPVGYIELKDGSSTYRPIFKPPILAITLIVGLLVGLAVAHLRQSR
jgi:hypothetical protein